MLTVEGLLLTIPSFTTSLKVNSVLEATVGATNDGVEEVVFDNVTTGPTVWVHEYERESPSGSELAIPLSVTVLPLVTVWLLPAFATGTAFVLPIKVPQYTADDGTYSPAIQTCKGFEGSSPEPK